MFRCPSLARLLSIALVAVPGCAYQLDTGHRDLDGSCGFIEDVTAPVARACVWAGEGAAALVGMAAAGSVPDSSDDASSHRAAGTANQSSNGDDPAVPADAKPLR